MLGLRFEFGAQESRRSGWVKKRHQVKYLLCSFPSPGDVVLGDDG